MNNFLRLAWKRRKNNLPDYIKFLKNGFSFTSRQQSYSMKQIKGSMTKLKTYENNWIVKIRVTINSGSCTSSTEKQRALKPELIKMIILWNYIAYSTFKTPKSLTPSIEIFCFHLDLNESSQKFKISHNFQWKWEKNSFLWQMYSQLGTATDRTKTNHLSGYLVC